MTLANKITITRLLLIPVFVVFAAYYSQSVIEGDRVVWYRIAALIVFAIASLSDALDGYIARNFNQSTKLGRALDPVADKLLLLAGVVTLSMTHWHAGLPIWFAVLVITRDVTIVAGVIIIHYATGEVKMKRIITSKICTFLQLGCVCWVLVDFWSLEARPLPLDILIYLAAVFTLISGYQYIVGGIHQMRLHGYTMPDSDVS
jgi:CDP-diacylglycerol--glycerol-3-phosphate 3-phosphatidyltransferase